MKKPSSVVKHGSVLQFDFYRFFDLGKLLNINSTLPGLSDSGKSYQFNTINVEIKCI